MHTSNQPLTEAANGYGHIYINFFVFGKGGWFMSLHLDSYQKRIKLRKVQILTSENFNLQKKENKKKHLYKKKQQVLTTNQLKSIKNIRILYGFLDGQLAY